MIDVQVGLSWEYRMWCLCCLSIHYHPHHVTMSCRKQHQLTMLYDHASSSVSFTQPIPSSSFSSILLHFWTYSTSCHHSSSCNWLFHASPYSSEVYPHVDTLVSHINSMHFSLSWILWLASTWDWTAYLLTASLSYSRLTTICYGYDSISPRVHFNRRGSIDLPCFLHSYLGSCTVIYVFLHVIRMSLVLDCDCCEDPQLFYYLKPWVQLLCLMCFCMLIWGLFHHGQGRDCYNKWIRYILFNQFIKGISWCNSDHTKRINQMDNLL